MPRITEIETFIIDEPLSRAFLAAHRPIMRAAEIVVKVHTDEGVTGLGSAHGSPMERVADIIHGDLAPRVVGQEILNTERLWQLMFASTTERRGADPTTSGVSLPKGAGKPQTMAAIGGIDIAVWDAVAKLHGVPVWQLLGGYRTRVPAYATGGYYRTDGRPEELEKEFSGYVEQGYREVKLKAGGLSPEEDADRARAVRNAVGPDVKLYVDASQGWSVADAIRAGRLFEDLDVAWYEEPAHWYDDISGLGQISRQVRIPLTSGESEYTKQGVRDLIVRGGISITNFDCTKAGGITEGRKIAALAEAHNVAFAPHHAAHIHAHLAAAIVNGLNIEMHPDPDRDPLWDRIYSKKPELDNGDIVVDDAPGFGYEFDEHEFARVATRHPA